MKWLVVLCAICGIIGLGLADREAAPPPAGSEVVQLFPAGPEAISLIPVAQHLGPLTSASPEAGSRQFVLTLPAGAIVIRAISRSEWASYQVRAEAWEWIEREMLTDAIVYPMVTAADVATIPEELSRTLRLAVNAASGFAVFTVLSASQ